MLILDILRCIFSVGHADYMSPDPNSKGVGMRQGDAMPVDWLIFYLKLIERVLILANLNVSENEVNQHK